MPPRPTADTVGTRPARRTAHRLVVVVALTAMILAACSRSRNVTITSPCETDVLVDWLYRSQGGADVLQSDTVIEAGEHVYADAVETEYIAIVNDGEVLAETSLPAGQFDADGANPLPPMTLPAEACATLTPAPTSDSGGGY